MRLWSERTSLAPASRPAPPSGSSRRANSFRLGFRSSPACTRPRYYRSSGAAHHLQLEDVRVHRLAPHRAPGQHPAVVVGPHRLPAQVEDRGREAGVPGVRQCEVGDRLRVLCVRAAGLE